MEKYCVNEIIHFLTHLQLTDIESVLITGNRGSIQEVLADLESEGLRDYFKNIIVATDDVSEFVNRYFWNTNLKIVEWSEEVEEAYLIQRVQQKLTSIKVVIDFSPSLRRLNRIYNVIDTNSVVILKRQNPEWFAIYPMLFNAFKEKITNIINYAAFSDNDILEASAEDSYFNAKMALYTR